MRPGIPSERRNRNLCNYRIANGRLIIYNSNWNENELLSFKRNTEKGPFYRVPFLLGNASKLKFLFELLKFLFELLKFLFEFLKIYFSWCYKDFIIIH